MLPAHLPYQIPHPRRHLSMQGRPSIFRDPHQKLAARWCKLSRSAIGRSLTLF
jgi:hypothetical protein